MNDCSRWDPFEDGELRLISASVDEYSKDCRDPGEAKVVKRLTSEIRFELTRRDDFDSQVTRDAAKYFDDGAKAGDWSGDDDRSL